MDEKKRHIPKWTIARRIVQVLMLALFCLPLLVAGWSLFGAFVGGEEPVATPSEGLFYGSLSASQIGGIEMIDPFAALQAIAASKSFEVGLLVGALVPLVLYGIVRGRAFCGWVCPVNLVCEGVDWLRAKLHVEVRKRAIPRRAKIGVAAGVLALSALFGIPVFEALSPISFINKGILFGSLVGAFTMLAIVLAELFWARRVWCRAICPLGGFYEAIGRAGLVNVKIDSKACIHCDACKRACLADPEILAPALSGEDVMVRAGDCMACGKCIDACQVGALHMGLGRPRKPSASASSEGDASKDSAIATGVSSFANEVEEAIPKV